MKKVKDQKKIRQRTLRLSQGRWSRPDLNAWIGNDAILGVTAN
jgi:hypothetical protein